MLFSLGVVYLIIWFCLCVLLCVCCFCCLNWCVIFGCGFYCSPRLCLVCVVSVPMCCVVVLFLFINVCSFARVWLCVVCVAVVVFVRD